MLSARHVGGAPSPVSGTSEGGSLSSSCGLEQAYVPPALGTPHLHTYPPKPLQAGTHQCPHPVSGASGAPLRSGSAVCACLHALGHAQQQHLVQARVPGGCPGSQSRLEIHGIPPPGLATTARPPRPAEPTTVPQAAPNGPLSSKDRWELMLLDLPRVSLLTPPARPSGPNRNSKH